MKIILIIALIFIVVSIIQRIRIKRIIKKGELEASEVEKLQKQKVWWTWLLILGLFPFVVIALLMIVLAYGFSNKEKSSNDSSVMNLDKDSINVYAKIHNVQTEEGLVSLYTINKEETDE